MGDGDTWHNDRLLPDLVKLRPRSDSEKKFSKKATDFLSALVYKVLSSRVLRGGDPIGGLVYYST